MTGRPPYLKYQPLLVAALALIALPIVMPMIGLAVNTATTVVILAVATMALNLCVGYTGLVSFGHSMWFGIGAYAAGLAQLHWFHNEIWMPLLVSMTFVAAFAAVVGVFILRRRGVYFSLLTLALAALTYTVSFRWSELTGGEDGLGGLKRGTIGPIFLDDALAYYIVVALIALVVTHILLRVTRSPFGHVLVAIRENQLRATFQGYPVDRYKLAVFVLSAVVTGLAGALLGFQTYLVSAEAVSVPFSGELLAMVVIGGMHHILGPPLGALFFIAFRELFSMWTANWLLWFGLVFVGFVLFSPGGLIGIWSMMMRCLRPSPERAAAMSRRKIYEDLTLPAFLRPPAAGGVVLEVKDVSKHFGGIRAVSSASLKLGGGEIHALIGPNGAGKTTLFNLVSGLYRPEQGQIRLNNRDIQNLATPEICERGLARSFQVTSLFRNSSIHENIRLSIQARHSGRFNIWRDIDSYGDVNRETDELTRFLGLEGIEDLKGGELSYGGQRLVDLGIALGSKPQVLLLDEPLAGLAAAERERVCSLIKNIAVNIPVLIVEHDIDRVLGFSHRVTVMNQGEVVMTGTSEEVRSDQRVQEIYTGTGRLPATERAVNEIADKCVLRFENVNAFYGKSHILHDTTLDVREGEIVALVGRNGAGKSTLLKTLCGLITPASGSIEFDGENIAGLPTPDIARMGVGYVPQGRGLFAGMTVADNLALGRLARKHDGTTGAVWNDEQILGFFPRLKERMEVAADYLSGGEQQMVAVARALSGNVKLLLLDEPFEGLSPAVVLELFRAFDDLRRHLSIVIVEHNLDLVLALADRVFALEHGTVIHQGPAKPLLDDLVYRKKILWL
jgi:ABC-type branched-subunit amino acid transport system ATPase component/ABC-type branched-subunit amino acid transport system permease subunit